MVPRARRSSTVVGWQGQGARAQGAEGHGRGGMQAALPLDVQGDSNRMLTPLDFWPSGCAGRSRLGHAVEAACEPSHLIASRHCWGVILSSVHSRKARARRVSPPLPAWKYGGAFELAAHDPQLSLVCVVHDILYHCWGCCYSHRLSSPS